MQTEKTQISLGIRRVLSESLLCPQWAAKDPSFLHADREDSDQTGRMPRLTRVVAGRRCHFVGFVMRWLIYVLLVHLFVYFACIDFCPLALPLSVRGWLQVVIVALPGLFY